MLHDFILENRDRIIASARSRVRERMPPDTTEAKLDHGIPLFLTQLTEALAPATSAGTVPLATADDSTRKIGTSAALHGHDLLKNGFTIAQVVHGYGDVCQIVTELAGEKDAAISADDFHVFNRCLDELSQKERDPVLELLFARVRSRPLPNTAPRASDDSIPVLDDEVVEHLDLPRSCCDLVERSERMACNHGRPLPCAESLASVANRRAASRASGLGASAHAGGSLRSRTTWSHERSLSV